MIRVGWICLIKTTFHLELVKFWNKAFICTELSIYAPRHVPYHLIRACKRHSGFHSYLYPDILSPDPFLKDGLVKTLGANASLRGILSVPCTLKRFHLYHSTATFVILYQSAKLGNWPLLERSSGEEEVRRVDRMDQSKLGEWPTIVMVSEQLIQDLSPVAYFRFLFSSKIMFWSDPFFFTWNVISI